VPKEGTILSRSVVQLMSLVAVTASVRVTQVKCLRVELLLLLLLEGCWLCLNCMWSFVQYMLLCP
jgi:hypothetical protein